MTNLEAIRELILPYEVSDGKLELLLNEQGLQTSGIYDVASMKIPMYKAAIDVLWSLVSLKKEQDNGSTIEYDVDAIKDIIGRYQRKIDEEPTDKFFVRDMTKEGIW